MWRVSVCLCRSMENFVQAYRDMSPARVAMSNSIKRSFAQMNVVRVHIHIVPRITAP